MNLPGKFMGINYSTAMRWVHGSSRIMIYVSLVALTIALYIITEGYSFYHAEIMLISFLPIFISAVGASYVGSSLKSSQKFSATFLLLQVASLWFFLPTTLLSIIYRSFIPLEVSLLFSGILNMVTSSRSKGDIRLSILLFGYSYIISTVFLILNPTGDIFKIAIGFIYIYAVSSIYSVTIHAFPATFREKPSIGLVSLLFVIQTISALIYRDLFKISVLVFSLNTLVYVASINLHRYRRYEEFIRKTKNAVAKGGMLYLLFGHELVGIYSIILIISSVLFYLNVISMLSFIHILIIGFVGLHIFIHTPLMLPVILKWSSARRYNLSPYLLLILSAVVWPMNQHVSFMLLVLAIVFLYLIVKPSKEPLPLSLVK